MLIKCSKGMFILKRNFRDAFNEEAFCEAYLEECFDNDAYIIGDIAAGLLRLKGFNLDPNSDAFYGNMEEYLTHSCVVGSPYYLLERIKTEEEFEKIEKDPKRSETSTEGFLITPLEKENFDKDTLELKSNPKVKPRIELNMKKINSIPEGKLPDDLKDDNYREPKPIINNTPKKEPEPENTQTYVSSSNGFDPTKVQNRGRNNFRGNLNNNKQENTQNNNNRQDNKQNKNDNDNYQNKKRFKNKKKFNNTNSNKAN